jgi:transcriptional regulator with XRE-family HTH domain
MTKISQFIKDKRRALKLTQKEMAEKAGVGYRFVRELEAGYHLISGQLQR